MRKSQENVLTLLQKHLWSSLKCFSLIPLLTRGLAGMTLFQGHMMHATRKKNQGEYVILAL
ncbi:hypothetical protein LINPERPRIM_LOCUS27882, partial [Linum perenne]